MLDVCESFVPVTWLFKKKIELNFLSGIYYIDAFMMQIRSAIELSTSDYDKEKLQERLAKLSGGVAVLKVCSTPA